MGTRNVPFVNRQGGVDGSALVTCLESVVKAHEDTQKNGTDTFTLKTSRIEGALCSCVSSLSS